MIKHHPRTAEPHHLAYLLSHVQTVAMDIAFMALGLPVSELAPVQPRGRVYQQFPALFAKFLFFVLFKAPQSNHVPHCVFSHSILLIAEYGPFWWLIFKLLDDDTRIAYSNAM